jgi:beta-lactam-binding protein with PASTA domain
VADQFPKGGTLTSWDTVRVVVPKPTNGRVPDVVGLTLQRARKLLARRDLAGFVHAFVPGEANVVLTQYPRPGRAAVRNMTIRLVVGRG